MAYCGVVPEEPVELVPLLGFVVLLPAFGMLPALLVGAGWLMPLLVFEDPLVEESLPPLMLLPFILLPPIDEEDELLIAPPVEPGLESCC